MTPHCFAGIGRLIHSATVRSPSQCLQTALPGLLPARRHAGSSFTSLLTLFLPLKQHGIYPNDTSRRSLPSFSRVRPGTDRVFSPMQRRTGSPPPTSLCHRRCKAIYKKTQKSPCLATGCETPSPIKSPPSRGNFLSFAAGQGFCLGLPLESASLKCLACEITGSFIRL